MRPTIYHNPRCSKSRRTLELIRERGIEPEIVDYQAAPPTVETLRRIVALLGIGPRALVRRDEAREEGIADDLDGDALLAAIAAHPRVLQRPIVVAGERAVIGRPPESVLDLL